MFATPCRVATWVKSAIHSWSDALAVKSRSTKSAAGAPSGLRVVDPFRRRLDTAIRPPRRINRSTRGAARVDLVTKPKLGVHLGADLVDHREQRGIGELAVGHGISLPLRVAGAGHAQRSAPPADRSMWALSGFHTNCRLCASRLEFGAHQVPGCWRALLLAGLCHALAVGED